MKKLVRFLAMGVGIIGLFSSTTSCKKDSHNECCTYTDDWGDKYTYCENDYDDSSYSFKEWKAYVIDKYGATCK